MRLGIDASNLRGGGGITHLCELLRAFDPSQHGFSKITVWAGEKTISRIERRPWLDFSHEKLLDGPLPCRLMWRKFRLPKLTRIAGCDVLFIPGGGSAVRGLTCITMCRNLLPHDPVERRRYGFSWMYFRLLLLRYSQLNAFRKADGVIFLTEYARAAVMRNEALRGDSTIIPHGIRHDFRHPPREQKPLSTYTTERPFRWLYVSVVDVYKHQCEVAEAVNILRSEGLPVALDFIGPGYPPALHKLQILLRDIDPAESFIRYLGVTPYNDLPERYRDVDGFVFASSCETFGQILVEAMASGLPIACSGRSAMPEILADGGMYFDPERPADIANTLRRLTNDPSLRTQLARKAFDRSGQYSWDKCATRTFTFLAGAARAATPPAVTDEPSHPLKVLVGIEHYLPGWRAGGPLRSVAGMVERLGDRYRFSILTRNVDYGSHEPYPGVTNGSWVSVGQAQVLYGSKRDLSLRRIWHVTRQVDPDIIYLNSVFSPMARKFLLLRCMGLLGNIAFVLAPRGQFSPGAFRLKKTKKVLFLAVASFIGLYRNLTWQASSPAESHDIRVVMGPRRRIHVAANLATPLRLRSVDPSVRPQKQPNEARFVFMSRIAPKKNLHHALNLLLGLRGDIRFDVFGPIEDAHYWHKCDEVLKRLPPNVQVSYRGAVLPADIVSTLSEYHFFLFPTLGENFGHAILEALCAGCPTLVSDQTPWRQLAARGAGWDIALEDTARWHEVLEACVSMNSAEYMRHSNAAAELAKNWLSNRDSEKRHITLFNDAASRVARA